MFLTNTLRASASSTDPGHDFWYQPAQVTSLSGAIVTTTSALRLSTVYKCVKVLAETVAMLPRHLYRALDDDGRHRERLHPVARLLSVQPNRWQTPMQFFMMMEAHRQLRGNAFAEIFYKGSEPDELVPIHPDRVTVEVAHNGLPRYQVAPAKPGAGPTRTLVAGEILHLTGLSMDGYVGLNPIAEERESIGSAIAARDFGSRFWNNDARPPFWIEIPAKFKDNDARRDFRAQWQEAYGGSNRGRPAALDQGMKIHELGLNNVDAQWLDSRKHSEIDICGLWRMPPHKIGILSDAKWANIEQQAIEFVTDTVLPNLVSWEQTLKRDLLVDDDLYVEFLVEQLLRGDTTSRYQAYGKAIQDGWLTRNEVRRRENLNPLPGLDEPLQPMNMTRPGGAPKLPGQAQMQTSARAVALLQASAERIYRREVGLVARRKDGESVEQLLEGHARFVAEVMAVPLAAAHAYVTDLHASLQEEGALAAFDTVDSKAKQIAALMRLEG